MSYMVERVTEAVVSAIIDAGGTIDFKVQPIVRAAIVAMREPTGDMVDGPYWGEGAHFDDQTHREIWRAMIDQALR